MAASVRITNELKQPTEAGAYHRLLCMTGPDKGKVIYLLGKRITIGRGDKVDIQLADPKMSREHAEFSYADGGYTITDLGAQNGVVVNDIKSKQTKLAENAKIVMGQTVLKYNYFVVAASDVALYKEVSELEVAKKAQKAAKLSARAQVGHFDDPVGSENSYQAKPKKSNKILIFGIVLAAVFYALFSGDQGQAPRSSSIKVERTNEFDKDFAQSLPKKAGQVDTEIKKKLETLIHSGRREFSEGNYFRAMEDFRLALLLNPNDGHASFYLSKAKQNLDDDIRKNFEKGKQEYESKKFQAAIVSYCSVVQLIQNYPNDERFKNAMTQISAIESELGMEKGEIKCFEAKSADPKD